MNGLLCGEKIVTIRWAVFIQYQRVTDGRTDGQTDRRPAYIYYVLQHSFYGTTTRRLRQIRCIVDKKSHHNTEFRVCSFSTWLVTTLRAPLEPETHRELQHSLDELRYWPETTQSYIHQHEHSWLYQRTAPWNGQLPGRVHIRYVTAVIGHRLPSRFFLLQMD